MPRRRAAAVAAAVTLAAVAAAGLAGGAAPARASNDPYSPQLWGLAKIKAEQAWARTTGGGIKIGVVDSGVDRNHPDLAGRVAAATTCVDTNGSPGQCNGVGDDIDGHGTHVAGTIAANANNGQGVAGVAPGAQLVVARVFKKEGSDVTATLEDIEAGVKWVVGQGAKVVNLSLGVDGVGLPLLDSGGEALRDIIQWAWANDAIPVVASGNDNQALFGGSENYGTMDAVVVGATGPNDEQASYSSSLGNAKWGVSAPGGNPSNGQDSAKMILSTWPGGKYGYLSGTSMAAPHVSAVLGMLRASGYPDKSAAVQRLLSTANKGVRHSGTNYSGRIDAAAAVGAPAPPPPPAGGGTSGGGTTATTRAPRAPRSPAPTISAPAPAPPAGAPAPEVAESAVEDLQLDMSGPKSGRGEIAAAPERPGSGDGGDGVPASVLVIAVVALLGSAAPALWKVRGGAAP